MNQKFEKQFSEIENFRKATLAELAKYAESDLQKIPGVGRWSALQAIQHLVLAEQGTNKYLTKKVQGKDKVPFAGITNEIRIGLGKIILSLPLKFKAPDIVANPPANMGLQQTIQLWDATRLEFKSICNSLSDKDLNRELFKHPFFGRLNLYQTMNFFDFHSRRHARQATRTLKEVMG
jgi:hypothetical protein